MPGEAIVFVAVPKKTFSFFRHKSIRARAELSTELQKNESHVGRILMTVVMKKVENENEVSPQCSVMLELTGVDKVMR